MWIFRELFRLLLRIAVRAGLAALIAGLVALVRGGGFTHELRIMFFLFGALLLLLAGTGNRATASGRRVNWGLIFGLRGSVGWLSPPINPRPNTPTLTASAVFVGSGAALIVLGFVV